MLTLWRWVPVRSKVLIDNISMLYDKGKINGASNYSTKRGLVGTWFDL